MLKNANWIIKQAEEAKMIDPFIDHSVIINDIMSYGLEGQGYTFRISSLWQPINKRKRESVILDPKQIDNDLFVDFRMPHFDLLPGSCIRVHSIEKFKIPEGIVAIGYGKEAYQRYGVIPNIFPLGPGYEGILSFSVSNTQKVPVRLYAEEGIARLFFYDLSV